jgi:hypothetical protein
VGVANIFRGKAGIGSQSTNLFFLHSIKNSTTRGMYLSVSPAMLMGWVTGDYDDGLNYLEFTP